MLMMCEVRLRGVVYMMFRRGGGGGGRGGGGRWVYTGEEVRYILYICGDCAGV